MYRVSHVFVPASCIYRSLRHRLSRVWYYSTEQKKNGSNTKVPTVRHFLFYKATQSYGIGYFTSALSCPAMPCYGVKALLTLSARAAATAFAASSAAFFLRSSSRTSAACPKTKSKCKETTNETSTRRGAKERDKQVAGGFCFHVSIRTRVKTYWQIAGRGEKGGGRPWD